MLFFAGTELGPYVSLDTGRRWHHVAKSGLPGAVRVDDLVIHPRARTGDRHPRRGVWVMDIAPLEQLTENVLASDVHLFDIKPVTLLKPANRVAPSPPGLAPPNPTARPVAHVLVGANGPERMALSYRVAGRDVLTAFTGLKPGLHALELDQKLSPGEYTITLKAGEVIQSKKLVVQSAEEPKRKVDE